MTSTSTVPDLEPAGAALAAAVAATDPGRLDAPTPCADWSVRHLLAHIDDLVTAFTAAAAKDLGPSTDTDTDPATRRSVLRPGWAERLPREIGTLVGAWRDPDAWTGMTRAGGVDLPGDVAGVVALDELVLHGWDLARATGQDYRIDETSAGIVLGFTEQTAADPSPLFGPAVPVPDGAAAFTRALGLAGRDPEWQPPGEWAAR
ncbi:TIGR03086 family metal-binding protein [Georgenia deserti]|uniref:TIGR03086 family metal-binding protein n=1 Tax=Georgenia deserti TaxID=2093781 RepID=A0ABW4L857_9MICO